MLSVDISESAVCESSVSGMQRIILCDITVNISVKAFGKHTKFSLTQIHLYSGLSYSLSISHYLVF